MSTLTSETVGVLDRAGKVEKVVVQMIVEDNENCEDGGRSVVKEMVPYEVDSIVVRLLRKWIDEKSRKGRDSINRAKETETWNPKSKMEPYVHSAPELVSLVKDAVDDLGVAIHYLNKLIPQSKKLSDMFQKLLPTVSFSWTAIMLSKKVSTLVIKWEQEKLNGAPNKVEEIVQFHVGDVVSCLHKASQIPGGGEYIIYGTVMGSLGALLAFTSRDGYF